MLVPLLPVELGATTRLLLLGGLPPGASINLELLLLTNGASAAQAVHFRI